MGQNVKEYKFQCLICKALHFETLEPIELLQLIANNNLYAEKNEHYFVDDMMLCYIFCCYVELAIHH